MRSCVNEWVVRGPIIQTTTSGCAHGPELSLCGRGQGVLTRNGFPPHERSPRFIRTACDLAETLRVRQIVGSRGKVPCLPHGVVMFQDLVQAVRKPDDYGLDMNQPFVFGGNKNDWKIWHEPCFGSESGFTGGYCTRILKRAENLVQATDGRIRWEIIVPHGRGWVSATRGTVVDHVSNFVMWT